MEKKLIQNAIRQLKDNQEGDNWLDESFRKKLEKVSDENAFVRPIPEVHSIAELVAHLLIWRVEGLKKLQGYKSEVTMDSPENWRTNKQLKVIGWKKLKDNLFNTQVDLITLLKNKSDSYLIGNDYVPGYSYQYLVDGWIHHDI